MERAIENPWITVSKRKRSRFSGSPHDAASRSEESQPNLPTNGFLNLTLHESAADDQHDGQATSNDEAARPSSSEGAVPPRKKTKKHPKKKSHYPSIKLKENSINRQILLTDFRDLVLWMLDDSAAPEWIEIRRKSHIQACVVLFVPGLSPDVFGIDPSRGSEGRRMREFSELQQRPLPHFAEIFKYVWITKAPGSNQQLYSPTQAFLNVPLSVSQNLARAREQSKRNGDSVTIEGLMMNFAEMREAGYFVHPLHDEGVADPEYVSTPTVSDSSGRRKTVIGLDCEMCKTEFGMEVTRVTLVDYQGSTLFDQLVKPENPVIDYLTMYPQVNTPTYNRWSGITENKLLNTTNRLSTIQDSLTQIIDSDTILVGHSLECDLQALKLAHPHVIDTSVIYQHTRGPPYKPSLKWLAHKWLNRKIQESEAGHDSAEDARTCVDLVKLKLRRGRDFGLFNLDVESLFTRFKRRGIESAVVQNTTKNILYRDNVRTCSHVDSDGEVVEGILEALQTDHGFVWGRMSDVETAAKWKDNESLCVPVEDLAATLAQFDKNIQRLWDALPPCTALTVVSGSGDPRDMARLQAKKRKYDVALKQGREREVQEKDVWKDEDSQAYTLALDRAKTGLGFVAIK